MLRVMGNSYLCCKECKKHSPGCHDRCVKYLSASLIVEEKRDTFNKSRSKEKLIKEYATESIKRAKKKSR